MTPLHSRQLTRLRILAGIPAVLLLAAALFADAVWLRMTAAPFGLLSVAGAVVAGWAALLFPRRRYNAWSYERAEDELVVQHGLWTRVRTVVPFGRVQHIDVTQGPLQRQFDLGTLVLHTAGTRTSEVVLPGLLYEEAVSIRDHIRGRIREDIG